MRLMSGTGSRTRQVVELVSYRNGNENVAPDENLSLARTET